MPDIDKTNPFSTRYWTPGTIPYQFGKQNDLERLAEIFLRKRGPTQIVGPHGSGKSTLLASLGNLLRNRDYFVRQVTLTDRQRHLPKDFLLFPSLPNPAVFFLDGYEQLSVRSRLWFWGQILRNPVRWKTGIILTSHRPIPWVPVLWKTVSEYDVFQSLVTRLTAETEIHFDEKTLLDVFHRAKGNFRSAFFELYDKGE